MAGRDPAGRARAAGALSAAVTVMLAAAVLAPPALAADGPQPPTPSPSALPSIPDQSGPAAGPSSPQAGASTPQTGADPAGAAVSAVIDGLVLPALASIGSVARASGATGAVGSAPGAAGAAGLEPGGGSVATPETWKPSAPVKVPVAPSAADGPVPVTTEQVLWAAYVSAAQAQGSCNLKPMLLASIGEVESSSLRGRRLDPFHDVVPPVVGPALTGGTYARIHDTDGGALDGDPSWDHAVGPMQFIPATWRIWGADGSGDGVADPQNVEDAALAAARYLCAGGRDLSRDADRRAAVRSYNHSARYVATVLGLYASAPASAR
ncbi:lytic transglycosylase domain-containing protein [Intrasporangium flavum]|uniref:lytic transglycosylase domain-containing protein n=1 Tax=Intrasporangium flavum TaxID=1428657 RepID=UPI00096E6898|nr:lytic transglycosylase domain-containing protein [Intrasporangium flavum]